MCVWDIIEATSTAKGTKTRTAARKSTCSLSCEEPVPQTYCETLRRWVDDPFYSRADTENTSRLRIAGRLLTGRSMHLPERAQDALAKL